MILAVGKNNFFAHSEGCCTLGQQGPNDLPPPKRHKNFPPSLKQVSFLTVPHYWFAIEVFKGNLQWQK